MHTPAPPPPLSVAPPHASHPPLPDEISSAVVEAERNRSRAAALGIAALVHVLLVFALGWIVFSALEPEQIEVAIAASAESSEVKPTRDTFAQRVVNDKPSPPSNTATQTISSNAVSPIAVPTTDVLNDVPAFGAGFGTGFGAGGFGNGSGASFFGTTGGGNRIILVIDTSTSMNGNCGAAGIEALRREIDKTISALSPQTRFNIICFGNDADGFVSQPVVANPENVSNAREWMKDYFINRDFTRTRTSKYGNAGRDGKGIAYTPIPPSSIRSLQGTSGGSRMDLALVAAFNQKPSTIFLIADGEPSTSRNGRRLSNKAIVDLIEEEGKEICRGALPTVNCISVKGIGEEILKDIAKRFRGKYKAVEPAKI